MSPSKDLGQKSSFDGLITWNGSGKTVDKVFNYSLRGGDLIEFFLFLFAEYSFTVGQWGLEPVFLQDSEWNEVRVGLEDRF